MLDRTTLARPIGVGAEVGVDDVLELLERVGSGGVGSDAGRGEPVVERERLELSRCTVSVRESRGETKTYKSDGLVEVGEDFLFCDGE